MAGRRGAAGDGNGVGIKISKAQPLDVRMHEDEAHRLVHGQGGYGLRGPLPRGLGREDRMRAYEARYVASGGKKAEKWQRRAQGAEVARNVGLAGATVGAAAHLVRHGPHMARAERAAIGAGVLGGAAEMAGEYARHRRARYSSAPGGVAASALRRMQGYTPNGG